MSHIHSMLFTHGSTSESHTCAIGITHSIFPLLISLHPFPSFRRKFNNGLPLSLSSPIFTPSFVRSISLERERETIEGDGVSLDILPAKKPCFTAACSWTYLPTCWRMCSRQGGFLHASDTCHSHSVNFRGGDVSYIEVGL